MATTEAGHHPNRVYTDHDGNLHLNGSTLYLDETATATIASGVLAGQSPNTGSLTATADGTGTGTIADDGGAIQFFSVTASNANHIVTLPTPVVGSIIILYVGSNGFELRSSAPATIAINGGSGSGVESAIAANQMAVLICTTATTWHGFEITGATLTAIEAAA
jgi:hypothetical protein